MRDGITTTAMYLEGVGETHITTMMGSYSSACLKSLTGQLGFPVHSSVFMSKEAVRRQ